MKFVFVLPLFFVGLTEVRAEFRAPPLTGPVIDQVGLLHPSDHAAIENQIRELNEQGRVQPQLIILKSLEGETIEEVGIKLADAWKLGSKEKDQGLIIIVAPNEHKMRLEVGRGLEGDIPDAIARRIVGQIMTPAFKAGLYASGIEDALTKVNEILSGGEPPPPAPTDREQKKFPWFLIIFFLFGASHFFLPLFGYSRRGSSWFPGSGGWGSGGGSGGGFWGGGGGGFNGGGSSGSW